MARFLSMSGTTAIICVLLSCRLFLCWAVTPVHSNHNYGPMREAVILEKSLEGRKILHFDKGSSYQTTV